MDTIVKEAAATPSSGNPATTVGAIFGATPGMPGMFKSNFDYQLVRGMLAGAYGEGGAFGELYSTARRVVDRDINSWAVEWGRTAERIEAIAGDCLRGGMLSARARRSCARPSIGERVSSISRAKIPDSSPRTIAIGHAFGRPRRCSTHPSSRSAFPTRTARPCRAISCVLPRPAARGQL
jgi:hypothetical protein